MKKAFERCAFSKVLNMMLIMSLLLGLVGSQVGSAYAQQDEPPDGQATPRPDQEPVEDLTQELTHVQTPEPDDVPAEAPEPLINEISIENTGADFGLSAIIPTNQYYPCLIIRINGSYGTNSLQVFNNKLYFFDYINMHGFELCSYDLNNVSLAADIWPGSGSSFPEYLEVFNNVLYFSADGGDGAGQELWAFDGTNPAYRVADINYGSYGSYPSYLTVFNNQLYFNGDYYRLYVYDGINPPHTVWDYESGFAYLDPTFLTVFNNQLYFSADGDDGYGRELWAFDGINDPYRVGDIYPEIYSSDPRYLKEFNNKLYFSAYGGYSEGRELWVYDGSNPPYRVADINPGNISSDPEHLEVFNNLLHFSADGGDGKGRELWVFNGTDSPCRLLDIYAGSGGSDPSNLKMFNNKLYFFGYCPLNNFEVPEIGEALWTYSALFRMDNTSLSIPDGWVLESARTSNRGGSLNRIATTLRVGDDALNRQYRSILHFNTAVLPDNAVITAVKLQVRRYTYVGTYPFTTHGALYVDLRKGAFSNNAALQTADWQAPASKLAAGKIPKTSASGWHTLNLAAANFKYINKKGVSQLRLRFNKQDNGDNGSDMVNFYSGNAAAVNRPKLIITYYVP